MSIHPNRNHEIYLGREAKSPAPAIAVSEIVDVEKAMAVLFPIKEERVVDLTTLIKAFAMFLNDQYGDCTCAGAAHAVQVFRALVGLPFTVTDADVLRMYEASGFRPGKPATDRGWTLQAAADYLKTTGLQGTPNIVASAAVSLTNLDEQQVALELFGGLYEGCEVPQSAITQYREGKPWTPTRHESNIVGGHCITRPKNTLRKAGKHVTWGSLQEATEAWERTYIDELMVFVPVDWEHKLPDYLRKAGIVDFSKLAALVTRFA
jgi:hypothetical protein